MLPSKPARFRASSDRHAGISFRSNPFLMKLILSLHPSAVLTTVLVGCGGCINIRQLIVLTLLLCLCQHVPVDILSKASSKAQTKMKHGTSAWQMTAMSLRPVPQSLGDWQVWTLELATLLARSNCACSSSSCVGATGRPGVFSAIAQSGRSLEKKGCAECEAVVRKA